MFSSSREMYAHQLRYFYLALLILPCSLLSASALSSGRNSRRRPSLSNAKQAIDEVTDKSETVADQLALATSRTEANQYRRGGAYSSDGEEYNYGNLEMNLVRPESEPVHTQITAKYTTSISARPIEIGTLDEAETAEEYVAKAMQMYGTRLHEPIHILPTEGETQLKLPQSVGEAGGPLGTSGGAKYEYYESVPNQQLQHQHLHQQQQHKQLHERKQQHQQIHEHQQQQQHQHHEQQQQHQQIHEHQQQQQQQHQHHEQQQQHQQRLDYQQQQHQQREYHQQQQQHQQHEQQREQQQHEQHVQHEQTEHKALLEAELRAQVQHAQQLAEKQLDASTERAQQQQPQSAIAQQPAPVYEKDPVTRSYEVYDQNAAYEGADSVDRHYRTKYVYQPAYHASAGSEQEEKLRVSASTEIPKAEIMKQIEKSVMKYMKELEAEGKIVAPPQEPQTYYKLVNVPAEEKHIGSTTIRPKYTDTTAAYNSLYNGGSNGPSSPAPIAHQSQRSSGSSYSSKTRHHIPKHSAKSGHHYQTETETAYQAPVSHPQQQEISEALAPNVEFIYKIKTRAPLQTATVKTISKPYSLPLKGTFDQFDHTAALKNIEEFDLSHVVTTQEPDERPSSSTSVASNKPSKMYFNSEIYHDINSLPYKPEKTRTLAAAEYRKLKASEQGAEYKGYPGYFAEPMNAETEKDASASTSAQTSDDGYPIMNPYQYILKKEPLPSKYEESTSNWAEAQQPRTIHAKPVFASLTSQKGLEYDSYSPKFNNNPEGYGYQHSYKEREREREREPQHGSHKYANRHPSGGKRGKRGGGIPHPVLSKKSVRGAAGKDIEASLALRPPPKV